jgi:L-asparaginase II
MLAVCRARGWRTEGYRLPSHRMQRTNLHTVAAAARVDEDDIPTAVDGCGVVTFALSLERMADVFTRLEEGAGGKRVADAMRAHPELIRGAGAPDTVVMQTLAGAVAKGGAEGLLCGALPDRTGFAIKCADGSGRALGPAVAAFVARLGAELPRLNQVLLTNSRGENVGAIGVE